MKCTSVIKGKACYECEKCIQALKAIVMKYRKTPMYQIPKKHYAIFGGAIMVLTGKLGPKGFQEFVKSGINEKQMTEQDMINFFNFEMGGPFNPNVTVNRGSFNEVP